MEVNNFNGTTEESYDIFGNIANKKSEPIDSLNNKKTERIDRSTFRYSEENFRNLTREEQRKLLEKYLLEVPSADFDNDQMFQFSRSKLASLKDELGFKTGIVDTVSSEGSNEKNSRMIYIDHGKRAGLIVRKFTLSKNTFDKLDSLLEGLSNLEKSKVIDAMLSDELDVMLEMKGHGDFHVSYRPVEEKKLI